jgi:conserved oligomeric Golgi complex subunit 2
MTVGSNKTSWGGTAGGEELILVRLDIERLCERVRTDGVKNVELV